MVLSASAVLGVYAAGYLITEPAAGLLRDQLLNEASTGHDGGAEGPRERAHVRTAAPSVVWSRQLQADSVFEHVRW